jgi:MoaA/NifB/PqqE/SkfB family radical SAM enzyme
VRLGRRCRNACAHCKYRDDVPQTARFVQAFAPLGAALPADLRAGDSVILHGPEPVLQPGFAEVLDRALAAGAALVLYTTGRPFADRAAALRLRRLGVRRFVVPVFGPDAARHDRVAGVPGAFAETRAGVANLVALRGVELRLDVLVVPRAAAEVAETVRAWRALAPGARIRLVHLLPVGGAARHPEWFAADTATVAAALRPLLAEDPALTATAFDDRRYPWVAARLEDARGRDERFARLQQVDAACAGPLCQHCAHDVVCSYFVRRREQRFDTYNLTVEAPCGLACGFCQRRFTDLAGREEPYESIVERFRRDVGDRSRSIGRVRINGSDPLAHPRLTDILEAVAAAGVRELNLFTPGLGFTDPERTRRVFAALDRFPSATVFPPIYGPDAASHDPIIGAPGAFDRLLAAMEVLQPYRRRVTFTTLVVRQNYQRLAELHAFVTARGFAMEPARLVRPFSDDPADYAAVAPRMRTVVEHYRAAGVEKVRHFLGLFSFSPCTYWDVWPDPAGLEMVDIDAGSYDVTGILRSHDQFRMRRDQVSHCDRPECAVHERCLNQVQYWRAHGFDECRPLDADGTFREAGE